MDVKKNEALLHGYRKPLDDWHQVTELFAQEVTLKLSTEDNCLAIFTIQPRGSKEPDAVDLTVMFNRPGKLGPTILNQTAWTKIWKEFTSTGFLQIIQQSNFGQEMFCFRRTFKPHNHGMPIDFWFLQFTQSPPKQHKTEIKSKEMKSTEMKSKETEINPQAIQTQQHQVPHSQTDVAKNSTRDPVPHSQTDVAKNSIGTPVPHSQTDAAKTSTHAPVPQTDASKNLTPDPVSHSQTDVAKNSTHETSQKHSDSGKDSTNLAKDLDQMSDKGEQSSFRRKRREMNTHTHIDEIGGVRTRSRSRHQH